MLSGVNEKATDTKKLPTLEKLATAIPIDISGKAWRQPRAATALRDARLPAMDGATLDHTRAGFVRVRGARVHNLKKRRAAAPQAVVFTGVSGSGKSSLAFGTLYAEAKRRYLESVSPYARRLFHH